MTYNSINEVQKFLADNFFNRTKDSKKAAGRALGTFVEIITYYLLKTWGFQQELSIETRLPEYGNNDLTHNVEFTLHNIKQTSNESIDLSSKISTRKILKNKNFIDIIASHQKNLVDIKDNFTIIKNGTIIGENKDSILTAYIDSENTKIRYSLLEKKLTQCLNVNVLAWKGIARGLKQLRRLSKEHMLQELYPLCKEFAEKIIILES